MWSWVGFWVSSSSTVEGSWIKRLVRFLIGGWGYFLRISHWRTLGQIRHSS